MAARTAAEIEKLYNRHLGCARRKAQKIDELLAAGDLTGAAELQRQLPEKFEKLATLKHQLETAQAEEARVRLAKFAADLLTTNAGELVIAS